MQHRIKRHSTFVQSVVLETTVAAAIVGAFAFAALASGCGDAKDTVEELAGSIDASELQHDFADERCREPLALKVIGGSKRTGYKFSGKDVTRNEQYFSEGDCKDAVAVNVVYRGSYDKKNEIQDNVHAIDMTFGKVLVTPLTDAGVKTLNTFNLCGVSDWAVGREVDVTGASRDAKCPVIGTPQAIFDIYTTSDNQLFFGKGDDGDKSAAEKRPTEINREIPYRQMN